MKKRVSIWLCLLLTLGLSACADADGVPNAGENVGAIETESAVTAEESATTEESVETEQPATTEESVEAAPKQSAETAKPATPQQSVETTQPATPEQSAETAKPATPEQSAEAAQPATAPQAVKTAQARELSESECRRWSEFLSQTDCYGFLMSAYVTPLDADLGQVFYSGAGVGQAPTQEMIDYFLKEVGFEEAYTEITFIPYDAANQVLERRTGYTLEHFRLSGNDIPMFYSQKYAGYFQMAGDTNRMAVECVSGREYPDGSITLESREKLWSDEPDADDGFASTFETTLRPDAQGRGTLFDSNVITGGWLTWMEEDDRE